MSMQYGRFMSVGRSHCCCKLKSSLLLLNSCMWCSSTVVLCMYFAVFCVCILSRPSWYMCRGSRTRTHKWKLWLPQQIQLKTPSYTYKYILRTKFQKMFNLLQRNINHALKWACSLSKRELFMIRIIIVWITLPYPYTNGTTYYPVDRLVSF